MRVVNDDLWLCVDCLIVTVNGDYSSLALLHPAEEEKRIAEIDAGLARLGLHLAHNADSETGEGIREFSSRPCDCCRSPLAGARERFALLRD